MTPEVALASAAQIAEEVLFAAALSVDTAEQIPRGHLDLLAERGFYGLAAPPSYGGLPEQTGGPDTFGAVVETLAGGCLATAFVWLQHHGAVGAVTSSSTPGLRDTWLEPLARGRIRAGLAIAGLRPGPVRLRARPTPEGSYVLDGEAPWVTGWGMVDVLLVAARCNEDAEGRPADDEVVVALVDAAEGRALRAEPVQLMAANASRTVIARFEQFPVPADRVTSSSPFDRVAARDAAGLRVNGSLALGLISRCAQMIGPGPLDEGLSAARSALDSADAQTLPLARAAASELAVRAAARLTVTQGSSAALRPGHADRLTREAAFLLVFGSRPPIRAALLDRL